MLRTRNISKQRGFSLVEILVVIGIIIILFGIVLGSLAAFLKYQKNKRAHMIMSTLEMALQGYYSDFQSYPPDNGVSTNGSEIIVYYLTQRFPHGDSYYGPYFDAGNCPDRDGNGLKEFYSPLGGRYEYKLRIDSRGQVRGFTLVDPGYDKLLGGTLDPHNGFQTTNQSEAEDNIYSDETVH